MSNNTNTRTPSFRPQYGQSGSNWRERQQVKDRQDKERLERERDAEDRKKYEKTYTNFPSMGAGSAAAVPQFSKSFAGLAVDWKKNEDARRTREDYLKQRDAHEKMLDGGVFVYRPTNVLGSSDVPEFEEEYKAYVPPKIDGDGWQVAEQKRSKGPRELSHAELDRKYAQDAPSDDEDESDHNGHLFDAYRRDHY